MGESLDEVFESFHNLSEEDHKRIESQITDEMHETFKQKMEYITAFLPQLFIARSSGADLQSMYFFGSAAQEYCKKFGCSIQQFIIDMKIVERVFIENSIERGVAGFGEDHWNVPKHLKKKNADNCKRIEKENKSY